MPSAAEQLASNFNIASLSKATELKQRLMFTALALIVARLGTYIPMPGIDAAELARQIQQQQGSLLDVFNLLAGGAIGRMATTIGPYPSPKSIVSSPTAVAFGNPLMRRLLSIASSLPRPNGTPASS